MPTRCTWCGDDPLYVAYHDNEWGRANHDDRHLFEMLILEGMQAGLSWITILRKRDSFREAFDNFNAAQIGQYDEARIAALMHNAGIIRNRLKIESAIGSARAYLDVQSEFGSFDAYIWQFVGGQPLVNHWPALSAIPAESDEARQMSKALKKRGFRFVGPTICYAFMQSCGMVIDHTTDCFLHPYNQGHR